MSKAAQYRFIGANCAQLAEKESHQHRRQQILHVARGWLALAENEEWLSASIPAFVNESLITVNHTSASSHNQVPRSGCPSLGTRHYRSSRMAPTFAEHWVETTPYPDRPNRGLQILVCARCGYTQLVERPAREVPELNRVATTIDRQV